MRRLLTLCLACLIVCCASAAGAELPSQVNKAGDAALTPKGTEESLIRQIEEAKSAEGLFGAFEELSGTYFSADRYAEFAALVRSLGQRQKLAETLCAYYCALSRYRQLKYLEATQAWDEYFSRGNDYRDELVSCGTRAASADAKDPARLGGRLVLWRFHRDQQDAFEGQALEELMAAAAEYPKERPEASLLKDAADALVAYGEKGKSKELYRLYVSRLALSLEGDEPLLAAADGFLREKNVELAESLYDTYLERLDTPELRKANTARLIAIAKGFLAGAPSGDASDPFYAEKVFALVEGAAGDAAFDEDLAYLRGFNLEQTGELGRAKSLYGALLARYPSTTRADTLTFKMGIIAAYVDRDISSSREYLSRAASKEALTSDGASSLYYLGLLSQWEGDTAKAKEYYATLLARAEEATHPFDCPEVLSQSRARLKEIEEEKPLEYNQKLFLDASLGPDARGFPPQRVALRVFQPVAAPGTAAIVRAEANAGESGCMQVSMSYFWSGDASGASDEPELSLSFQHQGTKVVSLVVASANGVVDRDFVFIDVR